MKKATILILVIFLPLFFTQCKGDKDEPELSNLLNKTNKQGEVYLVFTGPAQSTLSKTLAKEDVKNLLVTLTELKIHRTSDSDAGWHTLSIEETSFDLMTLTNDTLSELISKTSVKPGSYNQLRFMVDSATVITDSGSYDAVIPSSKIKMNFQFSVKEDGKTTINIEINPKASLKKTGSKKNPKYKLSPVLHLAGVTED